MNLMRVFLRFRQFLVITSLLLMSTTLQAGEQQVDDLQTVNADNLPQFVNQLSNDYYQQLQSLINYYQLYQQKRDPRGFNVWHLRGFMPAYQQRLNYYQDLLTDAAAETQPTAESMVDILITLDTISTKLMVSFRENNPAAYQQAKSLISENNAMLAKWLKQFHLDNQIREITLP